MICKFLDELDWMQVGLFQYVNPAPANRTCISSKDTISAENILGKS